MPRKVILNPNKRRPLEPKFDGIFRIVNWNTDNSFRNLGKDKEVVDHVMKQVNDHNANVICLQELQGTAFQLLSKSLKRRSRSWSCFFDWKELGKGKSRSFDWTGLNGSAICVYGHGDNFNWVNLSTLGNHGWDEEWWRYIQIDYHGVTITNVHTRTTWAKEHVQELHDNVTNGIIAGDFNYECTDKPNWFQTDLSREWTHGIWNLPKQFEIKLGEDHPHGRTKVDHILAINKPSFVYGEAKDKGGSNHRLILGSIEFPKRAKKEPIKPWIKKPVTKNPILIKPITMIPSKKTTIPSKKTTIPSKKTTIPSKKTTRKFVTKKNSSNYIPKVNDKVLVKFEQGDIRKPTVIGSTWDKSDKPPDSTSSKKSSKGITKFKITKKASRKKSK